MSANTTKIPIEPRILAGVYAAHVERWRRLYSRSPFFAPRDLEHLLPEPIDTVPALLKASDGDPNRPQAKCEQRFIRSGVHALARAKSPGLKRLLPEGCSIEEIEKKNGGLEGCRCKAASDALSPGARGKCHVIGHTSNLSFDPITMISEAREHVQLEVSLPIAQDVIKSAIPTNWASSDDNAEDFFKESTAFRENHPDEVLTSDQLEQPFRLRERTTWQLNRDMVSSSTIVLGSDGVAIRRAAGDLVGVSFNYRLVECVETNLLASISRGGIGVDEGEITMEWASGVLTIDATKSLRFEATREISAEQAMLLNMLAPATLSMLMQRLAFDGPVELIERAHNAPVPAPGPVSVSRTARANSYIKQLAPSKTSSRKQDVEQVRRKHAKR